MDVLTYAPETVGLMISGWRVEGWTEINVSRNSPSFKQIRGIRGKNTRTRIKDTSATLTIKTYQTELANEIFALIHDSDVKQGTARLEITLTEQSGSSFFSTSSGYILGSAELNYSGDLQEVVWTVACDESKIFVGSAKKLAAGIVQNGVSQLKDFVSGVASVF